jgi:hypothetical protein
VLGNSLFPKPTLALTFLLDEINVGPINLCGTHFQSVGPTLISPNKRVGVGKECVPNTPLYLNTIEYVILHSQFQRLMRTL